MSTLQVHKVGKSELQDGGILSSRNLSRDWQAFESTFEEDYYAPNICTVGTSDVSHLLESNDDELDPTFLSFFEDENDDGIYNPKDTEVNDSHQNEISVKESSTSTSTEPENVNDCSKDDASKNRASTVPSSDAVDSKDEAGFLQNQDTQKNLSEKSSCIGESKSKTVKCFSGKSKKSGKVTRTVTTETIFNGSIADIVKTRKRRAQCSSKNGDSLSSDYVLSHEVNSEFSNGEFLNSQVQVKTADAHIASPPPATERSSEVVANPPIKIKISLPKNGLSECQNNSSASKKFHKKKTRKKHISRPSESCSKFDPPSVDITVVTQEKCDADLNSQQEDQMNVVKDYFTSQVYLEHSDTNGHLTLNDKNDSGCDTLPSFVSNVCASKNSSISAQAPRSEVKLNDIKEECIKFSDTKKECVKLNDIKEECIKLNDIKEECPKLNDIEKECPKLNEIKKECPKLNEIKKECPKLNGIKKECPKLNDIKKECPKLNDIKKECPKLNDIRKECIKLNDIKRECIKLNDIKKECVEQPANAPLAKKKLRGIEEYRAHKAKRMQQSTLPCSVLNSITSPLYVSCRASSGTMVDHLVDFGSKLQNKGAQIPVVDSGSLISSVVNASNSTNSCPFNIKHTASDNLNKAEIQFKKSPLGAGDMKHFHLDNINSYNSVSSEVPANNATAEVKPEVIENSAISFSKSLAVCLPIQTHLPKDQCAFIKKSSQISTDLEVTKTSHDIPVSTDSRCLGAESVVATEHVNSTFIPCDRTNSKAKHNSHLPIPLCTVHSVQPEHNESMISTELSSPSTSSKKYYTDDVQACKELSRSRSVSFSSSSSRLSDRCYKRQKRNHSPSPASDTHSVSSYKRQGSYNSKSATYKKRSSGHSSKSRRSPTKPKKSVRGIQYQSRSRSSSSSSSSSSSYVRYKRRKRRRSRSRSQSYSRSPSTSDDDFTYDTYKMNGNVHRSSLSPIPRRERYLKHHSRFQNYSSARQRSSSRSSHHYANSKYLRYSTLLSHRKERRRHRQYSTSSYSTDNSYSRHRESSSRSRSRSQSYDRSYYKQYQPYRRQQQLSWEEQQKQIDERRVVYVGLIPDGYTRMELRERFRSFGEILNVRIHKRATRRNDNFGFVTFKEKLDAYKAVEYGNAHPLEPKFDISFGGRKGFCKQEYSDLDKENEMKESCHIPPMSQEDISFDKLLKAELQRVRIKSKKC